MNPHHMPPLPNGTRLLTEQEKPKTGDFKWTINEDSWGKLISIGAPPHEYDNEIDFYARTQE